MATLGELRDNFARHVSGDDDVEKNGAVQPKDAVFVATGNQHGGAQETADMSSKNAKNDLNDKTGEAQGERGCYNGCKKDRRKSNCHVTCSFCTQWYCFSCANMKSSDNAVVSRDDIFWCCHLCSDMVQANGFFKKQKVQPDTDKLQKDIVETLNKLETSMETRIEEAVLRIVPAVIEKCLNPVQEKLNTTVANSVTKAWSETLFGDDEYPDVQSEAFKNAPKKPKPTFQNVVKKAVVEQREEDEDRAERLNNVVLFRVPEHRNGEENDRQQKDEGFVSDLLEYLDVDEQPSKIFRLGKYKTLAEGGTGSRPLKVMFENPDVQNKVMSSAKKLREAPDNFKNISLNYDYSRDERDQVKALVVQAKSLTKNSRDMEYKVRGPPGKIEMKSFKKKA